MEAIGIIWFVVSALLFSATGYVLYRKRNYKVLIAALLLALLAPCFYVAFHCAINNMSEACVWSKSFLPLYIVFFASCVFPVLFLLLSFFSYLYRKAA